MGDTNFKKLLKDYMMSRDELVYTEIEYTMDFNNHKVTLKFSNN